MTHYLRLDMAVLNHSVTVDPSNSSPLISHALGCARDVGVSDPARYRSRVVMQAKFIFLSLSSANPSKTGSKADGHDATASWKQKQWVRGHAFLNYFLFAIDAVFDLCSIISSILSADNGQ